MVLGSGKSTIYSVNTRKFATRSWYMQFPLLTAPLSWQGPMHFHYRDSKITIAIIAISILSLCTNHGVYFFASVSPSLSASVQIASASCQVQMKMYAKQCGLIALLNKLFVSLMH